MIAGFTSDLRVPVKRLPTEGVIVNHEIGYHAQHTQKTTKAVL